MASTPPGRALHVETPLLKSKKLSDHLGSNVWMKLDNVQNSGSFKVRGLGYFCQKVRELVVCVCVNSVCGAGCPEWVY